MPTMSQKNNYHTYAPAELIAADLNVPVEAVEVRYNLRDTSDDRFGGGAFYGVHDVTVAVDMKKVENMHFGGSQGYGQTR